MVVKRQKARHGCFAFRSFADSNNAESASMDNKSAADDQRHTVYCDLILEVTCTAEPQHRSSRAV